jgi:hypothetical protein
LRCSPTGNFTGNFIAALSGFGGHGHQPVAHQK